MKAACYYQASGPLYPPPRISDEVFSCEHAAASAYSEAQLLPSDIDWFGLYDCFPICYVRALEAVGLARKGEGGRWVERAHAATQAEGYEPSVQHRGEERSREEKRIEERRREEGRSRAEQSGAEDARIRRVTTP